jgi:hypothetical protein
MYSGKIAVPPGGGGIRDYLSNSLIVQVEVRFWGCHNYYLFAASYLVRNNTLNDEVQPENW